ncbi:MAG: hypothetical protein KGM24_07150, partial [Elusimicrobia bacterium]|nr:hypothetical protein [Elusimicrobiota bacterium]
MTPKIPLLATAALLAAVSASAQVCRPDAAPPAHPADAALAASVQKGVDAALAGRAADGVSVRSADCAGAAGAKTYTLTGHGRTVTFDSAQLANLKKGSVDAALARHLSAALGLAADAAGPGAAKDAGKEPPPSVLAKSRFEQEQARKRAAG